MTFLMNFYVVFWENFPLIEFQIFYFKILNLQLILFPFLREITSAFTQ